MPVVFGFGAVQRRTAVMPAWQWPGFRNAAKDHNSADVFLVFGKQY